MNFIFDHMPSWLWCKIFGHDWLVDNYLEIKYCAECDATRLLTSTYTNEFDSHGMLQLKLGFIRKPTRAALRIARGVALLIGIAICLSATAHAPDVKDITPKMYLRVQLSEKNYKCASALIGKESAWNYRAKNGSHYGLIQIRNPIALKMTPYQQLNMANIYIAHRYGYTKTMQPNWCKAYEHWKKYNWQ